MRCLVVDDSNVTLFVTRDALEDLHFDVLTAKNLDEAYNHIKSSQIDVIITDILLNHESGIDLINHVKQSDKKEIPIIALTGVDNEKQKQDVLAAGANDYIYKPTTLEKICVSFDKLKIPY